MNKIKEEWSKKTALDKLLFIAGMICSLSVIVLALLQVFGIWEDSAYVYQPLMAFLLLTQAYEFRKRSRPVMLFSICAAALILLCWIAIVFIL